MLRKSIVTMSTLQGSWYNGIAEALGLDRTLFQSIQALPPMSSEAGLWDWQNTLPPKSLSFNPQICSGGDFFKEYAAAVALVPPFRAAAMLENDIGTENYNNWLNYLAKQNPQPTLDQLPVLFRNWAMVNAPDVANIGVQDLYCGIYFSNAQKQLLPYQGDDPKPVDFAGGYAGLMQTLGSASGCSISFDSSIADGNVSDTWTGGIDLCVDGLWTGGGSASALSSKFAGSTVTVEAQFDAYTVWSSIPGAWYNSFFMNLIYSNKSVLGSEDSWEQLFGPEGAMQYLTASLLAVNGIKAVITSNARYSRSEQQTILSNSDKGLWPFYIPSEDGGAANTVSFNRRSRLSIETTIPSGNPVIIGGNVLGSARYLGRSSA